MTEVLNINIRRIYFYLENKYVLEWLARYFRLWWYDHIKSKVIRFIKDLLLLINNSKLLLFIHQRFPKRPKWASSGIYILYYILYIIYIISLKPNFIKISLFRLSYSINEEKHYFCVVTRKDFEWSTLFHQMFHMSSLYLFIPLFLTQIMYNCFYWSRLHLFICVW